MIGRISREYLAQVFGFAVSLLDRVVLSGLLLRLLGVDAFASWTLALSLTGMIAIFDLGFSSYFPNRLFFAVEQGRDRDARHVLGAGNLLIGLVSVVGLAAVLTWHWFETRSGVAAQAHDAAWRVVILLGLATAARQAMTQQISVYRAHQSFFRQTIVTVSADFIRLIAVIGGIALGADIEMAAVIYAVATLVFNVLFPVLDTARRHPGYHYHLSFPDREERSQAVRVSLLYWVQNSVNTAVTYLPVLLLAQAQATAAVVAQFALMRTLANLVRTTIQLFSNVFGLEAARRIAVNDRPGLHTVYTDSSRLLAVQMGGSVGILAVAGQGLFSAWTGREDMFDATLFWLAVGPPLLLPTLAIQAQILLCANLPRPLAIGRIGQVGATLLAYMLLPLDEPGMRMMAALALGEILGFALPVILRCRALLPDIGVFADLDFLLRAAVSGLLCGALAEGGLLLAGDAKVVSLLCALIAGGAGLCLALWLLGLTSARRTQFSTAIRSRFGR